MTLNLGSLYPKPDLIDQNGIRSWGESGIQVRDWARIEVVLALLSNPEFTSRYTRLPENERDAALLRAANDIAESFVQGTY